MAAPATEPPATLPSPAEADGIADVGVLCVHGIGVQAEGETLLNVARPLLEEFENEDAKVRYGETLLKPRQQLDPGPARMSAIVTQQPARTSMLLAESWWAGVFDPPSYLRLLPWLFTHATWIMIRHVIFSLSLPVRLCERHYDRAGRQRPRWLVTVEAVYAFLAAAVSVCLVAVPMQWLFLLVAVVAIVPLTSARQLAQRIALMASAILGDASVYTANVAIRQAILSRVRADLDWLASRSKTVIVLAHSQGAAVIYDLLRSIADLGKFRLVTYGAGIRKLMELEADAQNRPFFVSICGALWFIGPFFVLMAWFVLASEIEYFSAPAAAVIGDPVLALLRPYLLPFLALFFLLYYFARKRDEEIDRRLAEDVPLLLRKNLQWVDIYASSDPVPSGPLLGGEGWRVIHPEFEGFRSREVVNLLSSIADHTAYWKTPNDFVPEVARAIRAWVGLPVPSRLGTHRKWRIVFRKLAGLAIGVATIAAFWSAGDPLREFLWMPAWNMIPFDPASITARIVVRYGLRDIAVFFAGFALYVGLAILYARLVLDPAWNAWERSVQNYSRGGEVAGNKLMAAVLARFKRLRLLGPTLRFLVCFLAVAVPLWLLAGAISSSNYGPTLASAITLAEWGREVGGWILGSVLLCFVLLGAVGFVLEWKERKRRGGGS